MEGRGFGGGGPTALSPEIDFGLRVGFEIHESRANLRIMSMAAAA
jgi:hypothetical protein